MPIVTEPTLKSQTLGSIGWTMTSQVGTQLLNFGLSVILAWLLAPEDFGLIGMMLVFTGFAQLFNEMGLGAAIVQAKSIEERHLSSAFYVNVLFGLLMALVLFLSAPLVASFFNEPQLVSLTRWMSLNFLIGPLVIVQRSCIMREMNFRKLAITEMISLLVAGIVSILFAVAGFGVYSLVAMLLVKTFIFTLLLWVTSQWTPRWMFSWSSVRELLGFSGNLLGAQVLNYWVRNADNLLIGKFAGKDALGLYSRAYTTMLLPTRQIQQVLTRVMFPALARIQDDRKRVKAVYLKMIQTISLFSFPAMTGLLTVAPDFVVGVYGPGWSDVTPLLQILCFVGLFQSVSTTSGWIFTSQGRTDVQLKWVIVGGILTFIAFGIGIQWGAKGVAIAYAIRVMATSYWAFSIPGSLIGLKVPEVVSHLFPQLLMALVMGFVVFGFSLLLPQWHSLIRLAVLSMAGIIIYASFVVFFKPRAWHDLSELATEQIERLRQSRKDSRDSETGDGSESKK